MPGEVLWQGHEVDAYAIISATNIENRTCADAGYERTGMRVGRWGDGDLTSHPDWAPQQEIWHRFNHCNGGGGYTAGQIFWSVKNNDDLIMAKIEQVDATHAQFKVLINGGGFLNVGAPFELDDPNVVTRWDVHIRGGVGGQAQVWYGQPGAQTKVLDVLYDFTFVADMTRIYRNCNTAGGGFDTTVAHEVVQTFSTLSTTSEIKPPAANGADVDGDGTFAEVAEENFSDDNMIVMDTAGQHQSFTSAARALTQEVVSGITISCRAWYEPGGPTGAKPYLTIGGVRYYGPSIAFELTPFAYQYTFQVNPATGVAFTPEEASDPALEWGWEAVA